MSSQSIDKLATKILDSIKESIAVLNRYSMTPGLAIVTAGDSEEAQYTAEQIAKIATDTGFNLRHVHITPDVTKPTFIQYLTELAMDERIHGVVFAGPLIFNDISNPEVIDAIDSTLVKKDAGMICPENIGELMTGTTNDLPPYALAILFALNYTFDAENGDVIDGKKVVIVTENETFAGVMAKVFRTSDCLVTSANPGTAGLDDAVAEADIVISAANMPNLFQPYDLNADSILVNAGLTMVDGEATPDVNPEGLEEIGVVELSMPAASDKLSVAALLFRMILLVCRYGRKRYYIPLTNEYVEEIMNPIRYVFE